MTKKNLKVKLVAKNAKAQEKKTEELTELVFILDRSGSMGGLEADTIGGFNGLIEKQKESDAPCLVSTVLFDHTSEVLHDRVPLKDVPPMTTKDYSVRGCTALMDAIGYAVKHIDTVHKYARPEDVPARTLFTVITDGMENASKKYDRAAVKNLIESHKEKGWDFIFIGANIDAEETAGSIGIPAAQAVNYHADAMGTRAVYEAVNHAVSMQRCAAPMTADWRGDLDEDYKNRGGKETKRSIFGKRNR